MLENRRVDIRVIAKDLRISYGSTQYISVNVVGMNRANARFVPKDLNQNRREKAECSNFF